MKNEKLNLRRFFRNRFELLLDDNDSDGSGVGDGSAVGLHELCGILASDEEPFPRHYDRDIRRFCGHEASIWFREERSYGDVARLVGRVLEARFAGNTQPRGLWVSGVLCSGNNIAVMRHSDLASNWRKNDAQH